MIIHDFFVAPTQIAEAGGTNGGAWTTAGFPIIGPVSRTFVDSGFQVEGHSGPNYLGFDLTAPLGSFWFHCFQDVSLSFTDGSSANEDMIVFRNDTTPLFRVARGATAGHYKLQYWDGSAWQIAGSEITTPLWSADKQVDIHIVMSDTVGILRLYINQVLAAEYTGDTIHTAATNIDNFQLFGYRTNSSTRETNYCEILFTDDDTRNVYVDESTLGTITDLHEWGGNELVIENANYTSTTFVTADAAGERTTRNVSVFPAEQVISMFIGVTARGTSSNNLDLDGIIRNGGSTYTSDSGPVAVTNDWAQYLFEFTQDPVLAAAWGLGTVADNYSYGLISVA